jgi:hypothetical protein
VSFRSFSTRFGTAPGNPEYLAGQTISFAPMWRPSRERGLHKHAHGKDPVCSDVSHRVFGLKQPPASQQSEYGGQRSREQVYKCMQAIPTTSSQNVRGNLDNMTNWTSNTRAVHRVQAMSLPGTSMQSSTPEPFTDTINSSSHGQAWHESHQRFKDTDAIDNIHKRISCSNQQYCQTTTNLDNNPAQTFVCSSAPQEKGPWEGVGAIKSRLIGARHAAPIAENAALARARFTEVRAVWDQARTG